jgi:hypothetical protein
MLLPLILSLFIDSADAHPRYRPHPHPVVPHYNCCVYVLTRPKLPPRVGFYHVWTGYTWVELSVKSDNIVYVPAYRDQYGFWFQGYWKII